MKDQSNATATLGPLFEEGGHVWLLATPALSLIRILGEQNDGVHPLTQWRILGDRRSHNTCPPLPVGDPRHRPADADPHSHRRLPGSVVGSRRAG